MARTANLDHPINFTPRQVLIVIGVVLGLAVAVAVGIWLNNNVFQPTTDTAKASSERLVQAGRALAEKFDEQSAYAYFEQQYKNYMLKIAKLPKDTRFGFHKETRERFVECLRSVHGNPPDYDSAEYRNRVRAVYWVGAEAKSPKGKTCFGVYEVWYENGHWNTILDKELK